jgi:hypothetical protein
MDISSDYFNKLVSFADESVYEFLSKSRECFHESVESVKTFLKKFNGCPLREFFHNFEDCPLKACLLFLYNSGHAYFPKELTHPKHSDECPSMKSTVESASGMEDPVRKALEALETYGESFTAEKFITDRLLAFRERVPLDGNLCACGCCGVRDLDVLDRQKNKKMEFVTLTKDNLELLEMNREDQTKMRSNVTYGRFRSHAFHKNHCYNLHGHLVSTTDNGDLQTYLCRDCANALEKNKIPTVSIAAGIFCTHHTFKKPNLLHIQPVRPCP